MDRPFLNFSIDQLEARLVEAQGGDASTVRLIAHELTHRRTPRARELLQSIERGPSSDLFGIRKPTSVRPAAKPGNNPSTAGTAKSAPSRKPTAEQQQAIDAFLGRGSLKINAYAGTGKTSTLEMLAHSTSRRGQYIAFNKKIVEEARERFPSTVDCATTHSLAFKAVAPTFGRNFDKLTGRTSARQLADLLGLKKVWRVDQDHSLQPVSQAFIILDTIKRYAQSPDAEPQLQHVPRHGSLLTASEASMAVVNDFALRGAKHVWGRMVDPADNLPLGHDGYLKLWALSRPEIAAEFILLDEAQDTNPVVLDVLRSQPAQMIYVGDRYQQIYEWRGAVNAMENIATDAEARLSQSFRFGSAIAEGASIILALLGETLPLKGNPSMQSRIGSVEPRTILARTNASTMTALIEALNSGKRPHLVGGTGELMEMLKGVQDLKAGSPSTIPDFFGFNIWKEVVDFADTVEGEHLQTFVNLVESRGERQLMWALNRVVDEDDSDLVISTAHKAKGREWDYVRLMDDFMKSRPTAKKEASSEAEAANRHAELRLFYVAMTRAKGVVEIPEPLLATFGISAAPEPAASTTPVAHPGRVMPAQTERPAAQKAPIEPWSAPRDWKPAPSKDDQSKAAQPEQPRRSLLGWLFGR